ncbi:LOW QUALITY PROTEIN: uncharacterized protein [Linepithema humile]|uniref:LOW QUALITY PROTEIN: uncharacterized protein n=1 Tax=Linepithema humile TaxID=83485 RepID=UPI00351F3AE6
MSPQSQIRGNHGRNGGPPPPPPATVVVSSTSSMRPPPPPPPPRARSSNESKGHHEEPTSSIPDLATTFAIRRIERINTNRSLGEGTVGSSTSCRAVKVRG